MQEVEQCREQLPRSRAAQVRVDAGSPATALAAAGGLAQNTPVTKLRGFILQASYRVSSGAAGTRVPVIHLYGRLEDGGTFLVRENRQRPHFYIRSADVARASAFSSLQPTALDKRTFDGAPVSRFDMDTPSDVPGLRERLHDAGIETFEADVRFALRYLMERVI
jgi:DNA polymerase-2